MKPRFLCAAALMAALIAACNANAGTTDQRTVIADLIPGCRFQASAPTKATVSTGLIRHNSGSFSVENARNLKTNLYIEPFYLGFACYDDKDSLTDGMAVRFDKASGQWVRSIESRYGQPEWEGERRELENAIRLYPLSGLNASGFAYTEDDLMGDEAGRRRVLHYCLFHPPKALCGSGEMGYVEDIKHHPKNDLTQYALKILRSIEFLGAPPALDAATAPASSPH